MLFLMCRVQICLLTCFSTCLCRKLRKKVEFLAGDVTGRYDSSYWYYQQAETRFPGHVAEKVERDRSKEGGGYDLKW